jgi:hypothetical protein
MFTFGFLTSLYICIAAVAALMTYCEQRRDKSRSTLHNLLGFLACALWPVTLSLTAVAAWLPVQASSGA